MNNKTLNRVFITSTSLSALAFSTMVGAVSSLGADKVDNNGNIIGSSATDAYQVTCANSTDKTPLATDYLEANVISSSAASAKSPLVSLQIYKGTKAGKTTDPVNNDVIYSPYLQVHGGNGTYTILVDKSAAPQISYQLTYNCRTANKPALATANGIVTGIAGSTITNGVVKDSNGNSWNLPATVTIPANATSLAVTVTAANNTQPSVLPGTITQVPNQYFDIATGTVTGTAGTVITNGVVKDSSGNLWNLPSSVTIPTSGQLTGIQITAQHSGNTVSAKSGAINTINNPYFYIAQGTVTGTAGTVISGGVVKDTSGNLWNLPATVTIPASGTVSVQIQAQKTTGTLVAAAGAINVIQTPKTGWKTFKNTSSATNGWKTFTNTTAATARWTSFVNITDGELVNSSATTSPLVVTQDQ